MGELTQEQARAEMIAELKAIKEARVAGNQSIEELSTKVKTLQDKMEAHDKTLPPDPLKLKEDEKWRQAIEGIADTQIKLAHDAAKARGDLGGGTPMLDRTGFTHQQRMLLGQDELKRYYSADQVAQIRSLQELSDEALIVGSLLHAAKRKAGLPTELKAEIAATRAYKQYEVQVRTSNSLAAATTTLGLELIPTDFSAQIMDVVAISLKLAALFPTITMPTSPFKLPIATSDDVGFKAPESTTDQFLTEANKISGLFPTSTNVTFTAAKVGAMSIFSEELNEDSVIAILPFTRTKIGNAIANAIERAILDGDTTSTHQDYDVTSAVDARKLWNGIRVIVGPAANGVDLSTFNLTTVRSLRLAIAAAFAEDAEQLAYAVSVGQMLKMVEFPELVTVDKFGPNATILRGQVGRLDNIPVLTSKYVRTDVHTTGVNTTGQTNNKAVMYLFNRNAFMIGNRRGITFKTADSVWTDQIVMVSTQRLDFEQLRSGTVVAAVGKNLAQ